jgi:hypothetical protein
MTWDAKNSSESITLSNNNLTATRNTAIAGSHAMVKSTRPFPRYGKHYWEVTITGSHYSRQVNDILKDI